MFTPLAKILPKTINKFGLQREVEAALICEKYRRLAAQLVHADALKHTAPKSFRAGVLTISVENSAWAEQVVKNKEKLVAEINKELGKKAVLNLRTRVEGKLSP